VDSPTWLEASASSLRPEAVNSIDNYTLAVTRGSWPSPLCGSPHAAARGLRRLLSVLAVSRRQAGRQLWRGGL